MGLDMFAFRTRAVIDNDVDFSEQNYNPEEFHYWRKHPNLHGWMERLYYEKGGSLDSFNCTNLLLSMDDLNDLEYDIKNNNLPQTYGFFFGHSDGSEIENDLLFIKEAKQSILNGYSVYYSSYW